MLRKLAAVTVIPGTPGQAARAATHQCVVVDSQTPPPPGPPPPPPTAYDPPAGTPILLETPDGAGGYTSSASVAPAPAGYVCRVETVWIVVPGSTEPAIAYNVVCTGS